VRWLAVECVSGSLVARLRKAGHDAVYVAEIAPGSTDAEVFAFARDEARLLLTDDKDFGDSVYRQIRSVPGVVLSRIDIAACIAWPRLMAAIRRYGETLLGRYTVIEETRFRSRSLP
jgi:predicted nuclease of predicted toxin-antitoxin system